MASHSQPNTFLNLISVFCIVLSLGCSRSTKKENLAFIVDKIGYQIIDIGESKYVSIDQLEAQDRKTYSPISFECARIRSKKTLDGYHGPTTGNYFLSIEDYSTTAEAQKRSGEYLDLSRLAKITFLDRNDLSKKTVRCWACSSGTKVYLLTTHSAMQSALEAKTQSVIDGIYAYEYSEK
ncbi:MAG: hypothetical protein V4727_13345 [Verrucomicrobiota bacterium]